MSRRVLLTGATGLVGSWVARRWPAEGPVLVPVASADADLLRPGAAAELVAREMPTDIVHLAWSASGAGYRSSGDNALWLEATLALAEAARGIDANLWLTGTVVDDAATDAPPERDAYALSKARLRLTLAADIESGAIGWLRPTYVVDEARERPALVAEALTAARVGQALPLRTPESSHDFVHAGDVGSAVVLAVTNDLKGYLPIGSGRLRRVADLVVALGARWRLAVGTEEPATLHADTVADTRWLTERGWTPKMTQELFQDD